MYKNEIFEQLINNLDNGIYGEEIPYSYGCLKLIDDYKKVKLKNSDYMEVSVIPKLYKTKENYKQISNTLKHVKVKQFKISASNFDFCDINNYENLGWKIKCTSKTYNPFSNNFDYGLILERA